MSEIFDDVRNALIREDAARSAIINHNTVTATDDDTTEVLNEYKNSRQGVNDSLDNVESPESEQDSGVANEAPPSDPVTPPTPDDAPSA